MTVGPTEAPAAVRRRPKDRKEQIARASADAFSAQGYHAVSMGDIASRVGISPAALYRHSPSKYDLFRDAVLTLGQQLVEATAFADGAGRSDPSSQLAAMIGALVDTTITNRAAGGLYRWEGRYLQRTDQGVLKDQLALVNRRLQRPLAEVRPKLKPAELSVLSAAALSIIGSITDHSTVLAVGEVRSSVSEMAAGVLSAGLPVNRGRRVAPPPRPVVTAAAGPYEFVLYESTNLFYQRGFRDTSMEDIAAAVGMQASGLYRYFPAKADILVAAYRRAADRISADVAKIVARTADPERVLVDLIDAYVSRSFAHPELAYLYYTERHHVPAQELSMLEMILQSTVEAWVCLVAASRPGMSTARARYAVHAAYAVIVDSGRLVRVGDTAHARSTARRLTEITLLGRPAGSRARHQ